MNCEKRQLRVIFHAIRSRAAMAVAVVLFWSNGNN
jgi:hypothetical protein